MKIIITDANILIDLVELRLLHHVFRLPLDFYTTALVMGELYQYQQEALHPFIDVGSFHVINSSADDLEEIFDISIIEPSLSPQDCSVFYYARKLGATLLTSDDTLRKYANSIHIEVHGHLWVLDSLVHLKLLSGPDASKVLIHLCNEINPKLGLPASECLKRHTNWSTMQD